MCSHPHGMFLIHSQRLFFTAMVQLTAEFTTLHPSLMWFEILDIINVMNVYRSVWHRECVCGFSDSAITHTHTHPPHPDIPLHKHTNLTPPLPPAPPTLTRLHTRRRPRRGRWQVSRCLPAVGLSSSELRSVCEQQQQQQQVQPP